MDRLLFTIALTCISLKGEYCSGRRGGGGMKWKQESCWYCKVIGPQTNRLD